MTIFEDPVQLLMGLPNKKEWMFVMHFRGYKSRILIQLREFSLTRSTAGAFVVQSRVLSIKKIWQEIM